MSHKEATIFHHPAWINLVADFYSYHTFVAVMQDDYGNIVAGIPVIETTSWISGHRWISLPFTDHCKVLGVDDTSTLDLIKYFAQQYQNGVREIEIRSKVSNLASWHKDDNQVLHLLELSADTETVYKNFHQSQVKRNITKAEREGVLVRWAQDKSDFEIFYRLYVDTRHRLGVPPQPKRYFDLLWERIMDPGLGFILLAEKDSLPIAGGVFLYFGNRLIYKYGASDYRHWRYRANHKLFWTAIQWGCANGYSVFDWGKTSLDNTGLREFKQRWGAKETILTYSSLASNTSKKETAYLAKLAKPVIQRSPKWVCRLVGELFYGFFA